MRVRDMHLYWCELCFACIMLCAIVWVPVTLFAIMLLLAGAWTGVMWVGGFSLVFGGIFFLTAYFEARSHWKIAMKGKLEQG